MSQIVNNSMNIKHKRHFKISVLIFYTILIFNAFIVIIPFWWTMSTSFEHITTYAMPYPPKFWPENFTLFNYQLVTQNMDILLYMKNTLIVVFLNAVLQIIISSMAGFALSKGKFPAKNVFLLIIMSNMMIPFETKLMPTYDIIRILGLTNTYSGIVLPGIMTGAFNIFLVKKFCDDLPYQLLEAATIDGAGKFRIYWQIYLPLLGPALATLTVLCTMGTWNDLLWPIIVCSKPAMYTIQVGLSVMTNSAQQAHSGMTTAASILSILPLTLIFIFMQRYIVQSIAVSGIKQ